MFHIIKRIIRWTESKKKRLYKGCVYSFFMTMFTAMPIMCAAKVMELVLDDYHGTQPLDKSWVLFSAVFIIIMVLLRFSMSYLRAINQESIAHEVTADERIEIGEMLKRVSMGHFQKRSVGEITAAITADLSYLELYSMKMIDDVVNGYIGMAAMLLCMLFFCPQVALIALIGVIASAISLKLLGHFSKKNSGPHLKAQEDMIGSVIEYVRGIPIVKAFKQDGISTRKLKQSFEDARKNNIKIELQYAPCNALHLLSLKFASIAIAGYSFYAAYYETMTVPVMIMMVLFSFVIFGRIEVINNAEHVLSMINDTMDKVEELTKEDEETRGRKEVDITHHDIRFDHVSFGYDKRLVLNDITFEIPENTTTAIVGPSGSGKTTICSLLAGFYPIRKGTIQIGGIDISPLTGDSLLSNMSMVLQKVYLFHDTILNNIKFGKPDASLEEVIAVAKKARCHDFIRNLPNGYETIIGEGGSTLSGGEKQRISIARAILKDAPIIILDEATASIDPENEQEIQQAISALACGKTVIIIAHRLATIEHADQILVVDDGKIVQRGTHVELIQKKGIYQNFVQIRKSAEGWNM